VTGDLDTIGVEPGAQALMTQYEGTQGPGQGIRIEITGDVGARTQIRLVVDPALPGGVTRFDVVFLQKRQWARVIRGRCGVPARVRGRVPLE
jgi:hypothetical protein